MLLKINNSCNVCQTKYNYYFVWITYNTISDTKARHYTNIYEKGLCEKSTKTNTNLGKMHREIIKIIAFS